VAQVEIISETEFQGGWRFDVQVLDDSGTLRPHRVSLAWADYNLWSGDGADAPARVIDAVLTFLLQRMTPEELPAKLDASAARRRFAAADESIPRLIVRS
jgi:hypothetical protein